MDKSIIKISGIIAFVIGIICCCTIFGAIVGVPLIIGGNKYKEYAQMNDEDLLKEKESFLIWTIVFLFLCTISGILGLIYYVNMENPNIFSSKPSNSSKYNDLEQLNKLYKEKVITKEEFEKEKERILSK